MRWSSTSAASLGTLTTHLISNLPYDVAAPIIGETLQHAPWVRRFCVMVQKEVADRLFAPPGTKQYAAISVLVQALCERTGRHPVARTVFKPQPNVDSTLVAFERVREPFVDAPAFARFVQVAFAHRRKTLNNNLRAAGYDTAAIAAACERAGCAPGDIDERLPEGASTADAVSINAFAPAKTNLQLHVGAVQTDGYHPLVSVMAGLSIGDVMRVRMSPADAARVAVTTDNEIADTLVTRAAEAFLAATGLTLDVSVALTKVVPAGAGLGGGSGDAGTILRLLNEHTGHPLDMAGLATIAATIGSDVPFFLHGGSPCLVTGRGEHAEPVTGIVRRHITVIWPGVALATPAVYQRFDDVDTARHLPQADQVLRDARDAVWHNDLQAAATDLCPEIGVVLEAAQAWGSRAMVSGSGSACIIDGEAGGLDRLPGAMHAWRTTTLS